MKALILSLMLGMAQASPGPKSVFSNDEGVKNLKGSNPTAAREQFLSSLANDPLEPRLHLNLGLTFEMLGQSDQAKASYETALKLAQDHETRFVANFNLGQLYQKGKKTEEALAAYQEALKYQPDSKETKTNIELLIQDQQGKGQEQKQDPNDQNNKGQGEGQGQGQNEQEEKKDDQPKQGEKEPPKEYAKNKPQPQKFKSEELTQGDVNKILGEIKQQEQKIRAEFNRKETKEQPRDKDW
jgi:Ca-activated chloride channel family protein